MIYIFEWQTLNFLLFVYFLFCLFVVVVFSSFSLSLLVVIVIRFCGLVQSFSGLGGKKKKRISFGVFSPIHSPIWRSWALWPLWFYLLLLLFMFFLFALSLSQSHSLPSGCYTTILVCGLFDNKDDWWRWEGNRKEGTLAKTFYFII